MKLRPILLKVRENKEDQWNTSLRISIILIQITLLRKKQLWIRENDCHYRALPLEFDFGDLQTLSQAERPQNLFWHMIFLITILKSNDLLWYLMISKEISCQMSSTSIFFLYFWFINKHFEKQLKLSFTCSVLNVLIL